ncbi:hypothetical protein D0862_07673 [Hortaea werneckii]|uniref:4Fe-4S ferredoxin-type domain-containing protein n=1 Tax=Hortaea werneckii TaxID=91943 RepID=A0A3M7GAQ9_HORWE|nr:hypothetical protein D0862_07673 [Hortaea werneckii]
MLQVPLHLIAILSAITGIVFAAPGSIPVQKLSLNHRTEKPEFTHAENWHFARQADGTCNWATCQPVYDACINSCDSLSPGNSDCFAAQTAPGCEGCHVCLLNCPGSPAACQ